MLNSFHHSRCMRFLAWILLGLQLNMLSMGAWANAVQSSAAQAQALGLEARNAFSFDQAQVHLQDVFPDLTEDTTELEDVFGDDRRTNELGSEAQGRLALEPSEEGEAYRTIVQSANRITPDLRSDPMFNTADQIRDAGFMAEFKESFADCSQVDVFERVEGAAHIPVYRTCERLVKPEGNCEITHEIKIKAAPTDIVFLVDNSASMDSVIAALRGSVSNLAMILGQQNEGDLRLGGVVTRAGQFSNNIGLTDDIPAFQQWVNAVRTNGGQTANADAVLFVTQNFNWRPNVEKVIVIIGNEDRPGANREQAVAAMNAGGFSAFIFHDNSEVKTMGTHITNHFSAPALFKMAQFLTVVEDFWTPDSCLDAARATLEEFCSGSYEASGRGTNGCVNLSGFDVCPGDAIYDKIKPPPLPNVDKLDQKVQVSPLECNYNEGQMDCWVDAQGTLQCPRNEGGNEASCSTYENDPQCGFVSQSCVGGAEGSQGTCYVHEEIWDCGYDVSYPTVVNTGKTLECPGAVACMGSECFDTSNTKSGDFAYAVAMLQVAQFAEHDLDCGETGLDCKIFPGEAMECKKALGGYVDCCEAPSGVSIFDYVNLTVNSLKMASAVEALHRTGSLYSPGYWQAAKSASQAVGSSIIKGQWGDMVTNATSAFSDTMAGVPLDGAVSKIQGFLMEKTYDAMVNMGAESAANAVFQPNAAGTGMELTTQAAQVINFIGMVYTAYVIADILVNIIWECEEKEFELGAKKETRQCTYVGSYCASKVLGQCVEKREAYCCYGSVVARIVQEQGKPQLGRNFGEPESPSCEAITVAEMGQLDWNRIDLTEWIGMLSMTGNLPTVDTVSLEHVTGSGSALGDVFEEQGSRANTLDRNIKRLEGMDVDALKREAELEATTKVPR